jgi:hypothetical protein
VNVVISWIDNTPSGAGSLQCELNLNGYGADPTDQEVRDLADYITANVTLTPGGVTLDAIYTPAPARQITLNP